MHWCSMHNRCRVSASCKEVLHDPSAGQRKCFVCVTTACSRAPATAIKLKLHIAHCSYSTLPLSKIPAQCLHLNRIPPEALLTTSYGMQVIMCETTSILWNRIAKLHLLHAAACYDKLNPGVIQGQMVGTILGLSNATVDSHSARTG